MYYYKTTKDNDGLWLVEDKYDWKYVNKTESVFTTENGYFGIRGAHDFKGLNDVRGMFVRGMFQQASKEEVTELINCPDVTEIKLIIDGERFSLDTCHMKEYSRKYNVHTGEVVLFCQCVLKNNIEIKIYTRRFVSQKDKHLFCQKVEIELINGFSKDISIETGINGQICNSGVSLFCNTECRVYDKRDMHYTGRTEDSKLDILMALNYQNVETDTVNFGLKRRSIYEKRTLKQEKVRKLQLEKFVQIYTDMDEEQWNDSKKRQRIQIISDSSYEEQLELHKKETQKFWKYAKIDIDGISLEDEAAICYSQYQLYGMTPTDTDKASIAAKGLSGEGYKGHVFWDTEIYMLPFYYYTYPEIARKLLIYRYNGLGGARRKAREYGYEGAMYPWEAAVDGKEETPLWAALNIHTGKATPVWSGRKEHHVTADIGFAIVNYYEITKDQEFLYKYGLEMLFEISKFWVSRAVEKNNRIEILDIIGPDEYNEHIDNNAFTNYMAKYCVEITLQLLEEVKQDNIQVYQLFNKNFEVEKKLPQMRNFVEKIYCPVPDENNIIPQDDTFLSKKELTNIDKYKKSQVKQAILLDYSRDEVVDMQVLKQADLVMLLNLFPNLFEAEIVKKNVLYYEARTLHDSSLSYCAHAQACANIGAVEESLNFFREALEVDLVDNPYDSVDGLHSASMGGIWNCIIQGYAGLSHDKKGIRLAPHLPEEWNKIQFYIKVKGTYYKVAVTKKDIVIEAKQAANEELQVCVYGVSYVLQDAIRIQL